MRGNIRAAAVPMVPFTFDFARVKSYDGDKSKGYREHLLSLQISIEFSNRR